MKQQIRGFICGALAAALVLGSTISALAASGYMTLEVVPVNIQVNGELFLPKDVNGNDVPVFAYKGTTYAPLRALAEAYGLEVGYSAEVNLATVSRPAEIASGVQANTSQGIKVYEEFPGVPDFGAITGMKLVYWSKYGNDSGIYTYDLDSYAGVEDSVIENNIGTYLNNMLVFNFKPNEELSERGKYCAENKQYILTISFDNHFLSVIIIKKLS